jgi:hypothetical protein
MGEEPEDQGEDDADDQARDDGEIDGVVFAAVDDVAGRRPRRKGRRAPK